MAYVIPALSGNPGARPNPLAPCGRDKSEGETHLCHCFVLPEEGLAISLPLDAIPAQLVPDSIREQESRPLG